MAGIQSTLETIKASIVRGNGLARGNRFEVIFTLPPALSSFGDSIGAAREISILAQSTFIPGKTINTMDFQSVRQSVKIPTGYILNDISMTFLLTNDYLVKRIFDRWVNASVDQETYRILYDNYYCSDIQINQLDLEDKVVYSVKLLKAWPISYESIALDQEAGGDSLKLIVNFAYEDFLYDEKTNVRK
jgi:hypothetical protein